MSLKWTMPFPGACWQLVMDGYRYYIQDVDLSGSMVAIYRHPAGKTESHKFLTFRDMYKSLFGSDAPEIWDETAIQIEMRRRGTCHYGLWSYTAQDGRLYALNFREKEYHEYFDGEKVSPAFNTIPEAKAWADEYLEKTYAATQQMRLEV